MNIEAKQVKCGDCIILEEKQEKLIIDCGSDNSGYDVHGSYLNSSMFAYDQLRKELLDNCHKSLLITHFHKDHFNGILEIKQDHIFENIYIPPCLTKEVAIVTEAMGQLAFLSTSASRGFMITNQIRKLINQLPILVKNSRNIKLITAGDIFTFADRTFQVLWPDVIRMKMVDIKHPETVFVGYKTEKPITNIFKTLDEVEKEEIHVIEKDTVRIYMDHLNGTMQEIYRRHDLEGVQQLQIDFQYSVYNYMDLLSNRDNEQNSDRNLEQYLNKINSSFNELRDYHNKLIGSTDKSEKEQIQRSYLYFYHILINSINACSIIFSNNQDCLFMGDAPKHIIKHLRENGSMAEYYKVVKLQHHATIAYETIQTPEAECYIISNGGMERRKIGRGFIDPMPIAGENYKVNRIICTNGRDKPGAYCQYYKNERHCYSKCIEEMYVKI